MENLAARALRRSLVALLVTSTLTASALAVAAPASDGETPVAVAASAAPGPKAEVAADPNIDRGLLLPTAMTQPAGSLTYNNYELLLHGLTYGITDRVQFTATVLPPLVKEMPLVGFASVKGRVVAMPRFHLALQGTAGVGHEDDDSAFLFGAGAVATGCLTEDCSSLLSASATYTYSFSDGSDNRVHTVLYGASLVHRVGAHVKLLGEVTSIARRDLEEDDFDNLPGALVSYGVRFHTANIAGDIGFVKPVGDEDDDFVMGLPFVNVSYRWQ